MIEIVRGCLAACMTKIAKRGVELSKESARAVQRGGHMDPKRKDWEGLHSCKSDLMASVCDKKDLFLFEIYYQQILSNEFTLR